MSNETYQRIAASVPDGLAQDLHNFLAGTCVGRKNAASREVLLLTFGVDERKIRLAVHRLRREFVPICSAPGKKGGYWLAANWDEVKECCEREFHAKAMDLLETEKAMHEAARMRFGEATQAVLL
jgi:hypothetical protein